MAPGGDRERDERGIEGEDAARREEVLEGRMDLQTIGPRRLFPRW